MSERRPGHLYVLLAMYRKTDDHVEQFIEVEDHEGKGIGHIRSLTEGQYRLLELPDPREVERLIGEAKAEGGRKGLARASRLIHAAQQQAEDDGVRLHAAGLADARQIVKGLLDAEPAPKCVTCGGTGKVDGLICPCVTARDAEPAPAAGETCYRCGRQYQLVYRVPNEVWAKIRPVSRTPGKPEHMEHQYGGMLCPDCASLAAKVLGITLNFDGVIGEWGEPATDTLAQAKALVDKQAKDAALWTAVTVSEAYVQQALRALHAAVEGEPAPGEVGP